MTEQSYRQLEAAVDELEDAVDEAAEEDSEEVDGSLLAIAVALDRSNETADLLERRYGVVPKDGT